MFFTSLEKSLQSFDPSQHLPSRFFDTRQSIIPSLGAICSHHAAVLVLITDEKNPHVIYAKRASHLSSHANEICFPGGKWEAQDASLADTALRETEEELGVQLSPDQLLGVLPSRATRNGLGVLPLVARVSPQLIFVPNPTELSEVFRVPLAMLNHSVKRIDRFERAGLRFDIPVYAWEQHEIWGFTAAVTQDLLKLTTPIMRENE